jgi:hypothetical protein
MNALGIHNWVEESKQASFIADSADFVEQDTLGNLWGASHTAVHL